MKRNTLFACLFVVGSFLVPLFFFELYLRIAGINATYTEKIDGGTYQSAFAIRPGAGWLYVYSPHEARTVQTKEFVISVQANAEGCKDREWSLTKHKKRIFCLGDSFTEGIGSSKDSSYPDILQQLVGDSIEVCNAGISGSDPFYEYMLLKQKLLKYKPDVVLVSINQTDVHDCLVRGGFERFRPDGNLSYNQPPWWEGLYARFYTLRYIVINICHYSPLFISSEQLVFKEKQAERQLISCVDSFSALCNAHAIQPVFVFHPMISELRENKLKCRPVMDHCRNRLLPVVDVLAYFRSKHRRELTSFFWSIDQHNNNAGYHLFAEAVAEKILALPSR